jgi:hypothetical protein
MRLPVYDVGQSAPQGGVEVILAIEQGGRGSPMRRFLIGLVVVLLLIASIGVGVTVARWPDLMLSWQPDRAR